MFKLPTEPHVPSLEASKLKLLIYGESKIGKSSFCSNFPDTLFIATEHTLEHLPVHKIQADDWKTFLNCLNSVEKTNHNFKTIVIDTIDQAFEMCRHYILGNPYSNLEKSAANFRDESSEKFGGLYIRIYTEFLRVMKKIITLGYGTIFVCHERRAKIDKSTKTTNSFDRFEIALPQKVTAQLTPLVDSVMRVVKHNGKHCLITSNAKYSEAGNRLGLEPLIELDYNIFIENVKKGLTKNSKPRQKKSKELLQQDQPTKPSKNLKTYSILTH